MPRQNPPNKANAFRWSLEKDLKKMSLLYGDNQDIMHLCLYTFMQGLCCLNDG